MTDFFDRILNDEKVAVHIEFNGSLSDLIAAKIKNKKTMVLRHDDGLYHFLTVKHHLELFRDLSESDDDLDGIMDTLDLHRYAQMRLENVSDSIKRRVLLGCALVSRAQCLIFEEPLMNVDQKSAHLIVQALELLSDRMKVITTSFSFRNVCLMSGNLYHYKNDHLTPIYESFEFGHDEGLNHDGITNTLVVKNKGVEYIIDTQDIFYAESIDSVCHLYVKNSLIPIQYTLEELEEQLKHLKFFRCHRSYIVNVQKVAEIQQWTRNSYVLVLNSEQELEIPLSKRRYPEFKAMLHSPQ